MVILHETASEGAAKGRQEAEARLGFSSLAERKRGEAKARVLLGRWLGETGQGFGTDVTGGTQITSAGGSRQDCKLQRSRVVTRVQCRVECDVQCSL